MTPSILAALQAATQAVTDSAATVPAAGAGIGRFTGLLGIAAIVGVGYLLSRDKKAIKWRVVGIGLTLQFAFAFFVLKVDFGRALFERLGAFITGVLGYSSLGAQFVFGQLAIPSSPTGMVFAAAILPAIIFVSALFAILYYLAPISLVITVATARTITCMMPR